MRASLRASCARTHGPNTARFEKTRGSAHSYRDLRKGPFDSRRHAMYRIANAQVWVHDQDEALAFYTQKLGMEVRSDVTVPELGNFRWLAVGPPGQPEIAIVLMAIPGPPVMDAATAKQVADLMGKGFAGTVF